MRKGAVYLLIISAIVVVFYIIIPGFNAGTREISFTEVVTMSKNGGVDTIEVKGQSLTIISADGSMFKSRIGEGIDVLAALRDEGVRDVKVIFEGSGGFSLGILLY